MVSGLLVINIQQFERLSQTLLSSLAAVSPPTLPLKCRGRVFSRSLWKRQEKMNFPIGNQYITPQSALEQVIKSRLVPGVLTSLWSRGADEPTGINNAVPQNELLMPDPEADYTFFLFFFVFWLWKQMNKQTCLVEYEKWVLLVPR